MARVFGLFDTRAQAEDAAQRLIDAGVPLEALTVVARDERQAEAAVGDAVAGAPASATAQGAMEGGVMGLLAGVSLAAVPALGPVLMFGAPLTAAAGAVLGGATGAAMDPATDTRVYAEGVRRGGTFVSADVPDERAEPVRDVMLEAGAVDIHSRMAQWRGEGWTLDESASEPYDAFGAHWSESSKIGTAGGTLAGAAAGAAAGAIGGPLGVVLGGIAGAAAGAGIGAIGDYAGEAAQHGREEKKDDA
ncbi:MAG: hypothetical protein RLZZ387_1289 [Chloroflexota bacterium]